MNKIEIKINPQGIGKIIVNGKDISDSVTGFTITSDAGEMPEITIKTGTEELNCELYGIIKHKKEEDVKNET